MLRGKLVNTKKCDMSADQFIALMKSFASELAAAGRIIDDDELKEYILGGLDGEYNSLVASVNAVPTTTLADVCAQLTAYDCRQQMLAETGQAIGRFQSSAKATTRGRPNNNSRQNSRG